MASPEVTRLVLVRHGEAVCNVERRAGGVKGCTGLSELGRRQAEALRDRLLATGEIRADVVYASTLPRAWETAEIVAEGFGEAPVIGDDDLHELRPGEFDGLTWEEIERRAGAIDVEREPYRPIGPGGESWAEFQLRVGRTVTRLVDAHPGQTIVVVAHGGVVDGTLGVLFGVSPLALRTIHVSLTEVSREVWPDRDPRWLLWRFNDASHLRGLQGSLWYPGG